MYHPAWEGRNIWTLLSHFFVADKEPWARIATNKQQNSLILFLQTNLVVNDQTTYHHECQQCSCTLLWIAMFPSVLENFFFSFQLALFFAGENWTDNLNRGGERRGQNCSWNFTLNYGQKMHQRNLFEFKGDKFASNCGRRSGESGKGVGWAEGGDEEAKGGEWRELWLNLDLWIWNMLSWKNIWKVSVVEI